MTTRRILSLGSATLPLLVVFVLGSSEAAAQGSRLPVTLPPGTISVSSPAAVPIGASRAFGARVLPADTQRPEVSFRNHVLPPAILMSLGLLAYGEGGLVDRYGVKEWREEFIPQFEDHIDDWGQIAPGVLALGMSIGGVEGTHNTARSAGSWALGTGIMMLGVHGVKNRAHVLRPNGSNTHSFPSGHTASAFTAARYLDREYRDVSPAFPIIGYTIAAGTGMFRQLNDAHWLSDVLVGAGIGYLSTDLAYAILDEVFGEKGENPWEPQPERPRGNPHFLDFRFGYATHTGDIDDGTGTFRAGEGWNAGFEGAWFPWPNVGIGGEWSWVSFPIDNTRYTPPDNEIGDMISGIRTQPLGAENIFVGPFFDLPLGDRWALTGKLVAGVANGATGQITAEIKPEMVEEVGASEVAVLEYLPARTFGFATGASLRFLLGERMAVRAYGEWNWSQPDYTIRTLTEVPEAGRALLGAEEVREAVDFSFFAFGLSVSALLW